MLNLFPAIPNGGTAKEIKLEKTCSVIPNGGGTELLQFIKNYCRKYFRCDKCCHNGIAKLKEKFMKNYQKRIPVVSNGDTTELVKFI